MKMAIPCRIGSYLSRDVCAIAVDEIEGVTGLAMDKSLVLINAASANFTKETRTRLADQLVQLRPLGVFFTGSSAEAMFDCLLHALDTPGAPLSVMTNFSSDSLSQALEEFLSSTWPSEECWEQWRGYLLVNIGGSVRQLEEAAKHVIDTTAESQ